MEESISTGNHIELKLDNFLNIHKRLTNGNMIWKLFYFRHCLSTVERIAFGSCVPNSKYKRLLMTYNLYEFKFYPNLITFCVK